MKKIVFFTNLSTSHLIPIKELIFVLSKKYEIYIFGVQKNKSFFEDVKINYIEYPETFLYTEKNIKYKENLQKNIYLNLENNELEKFLYHFFKLDLLKNYNYNQDEYNSILEKFSCINPYITFVDSTIFLAQTILKSTNSNYIKYVTNSIYCKENILGNKEMFETFFLQSFGNYPQAKKFIKGMDRKYFWNVLEKINEDISFELKVNKIDLYPQYNLSDKYNIVFSYDFLQPYISKKNYILISKPLNVIKKNEYPIKSNIENFMKINKYKYIIYISDCRQKRFSKL